MDFCKNCGALLPADALRCPQCGAALPHPFDNALPITGPVPTQNAAPLFLPAQAAAAADPAQQPAAPGAARAAEGAPSRKGPFYTPSSAYKRPAPPRRGPAAPGTPDGALSTADYFWSLVLFKIPLVGLVFMFLWGFGSSALPARRNLARAYLIRTALVLALLILGALVFLVLFIVASNTIQYYDFAPVPPIPFDGYGAYSAW